MLGVTFALLVPIYLSFAQAPLMSRVSGTLNTQFDRHYLTLRVGIQRQPLRVVMEYVPQGIEALDNRSNFWIFDPNGLEAYLAGGNPGAIAVAAGDRLPGEGRRLQAIIENPSRDVFYIVVYNDSPVPMNYTLIAENGEIIDESGGQAIDVYNPPPSGGGEPPLVQVPGPSPTPSSTPLPPRRVKSVMGVLTHIRDSDYYEMVVLDTGRPVQIEMTYDPEEQFKQTKGFEFNVFSDHQFREMTRDFILPWRAQDMTEGHLTITGDGRYIWRAEIVEPYQHYFIVVSQWRYALKWLGYRLSVENAAILVPREPTPTPTPTRAPAGPSGPFVVVTVIVNPTVTPTATPTSDFTSPLPTVQSPLPTP